MRSAANPFAGDSAERYDRGRPYHHRRTLRRALNFIGVRTGAAADVGCGTGQSTIALAELGFAAAGFDVSEPMLSVARRRGLPVTVADAARLPLRSGTVDLVTVSSAVHWFDATAFHTEAARVLQRPGWLIVYDHGFLGESPGQPEFATWARNVYLSRYPSPPRNPWSAGDRPAGFTPAGSDRFVEQIELSHEQLVAYLLTQSNTIAAVEHRGEPLDEVAAWLEEQTIRFFRHGQSAPFSFWASIDALQAD